MTNTELLARAFSEWERRYREDPDGFADDMERLSTDLGDYGLMCAAYFQQLLGEVA